MRKHVLVVILLALTMTIGLSMSVSAAWPPAPGQTGTITILAPNAQDGATAKLWGFYAKGSGWVNTTFGSGTISGGAATVNYTVPLDFTGNFYWNAIVKYSAGSNAAGQ